MSFKGFIDTTFRDGQQSPLMFDSYKYRLTLENKKNLIYGLIRLGVRNFEFFAPNVSKSEAQDFIEIKDYVASLKIPGIRFLAHCRCHPNDIKEAIKAGFDGLNLYIGMTEFAQRFSHGMNMKEIIINVKKIIQATRKFYPRLYLRFSAEDSFRTPLNNIFRMYNEIHEFVDTLGIPDTVGIATPETVAERIKAFKIRYPKVDIECHFHNDRGLSLINALKAIETGASYIDTSIWGMAERSGITSITALLLNLYYENKSLCKDYDLRICYPLNVLMGSILKLQVSPAEPVSITNRTHTAGVHQKAVLNNPYVYEAHNLKIFGVEKNQLLLGPLSGKNLIYYYLREIEYYDLTLDQAAKISQEFKSKSGEMNKKNKPEVILKKIVGRYNLPKLSIKKEFLKNRVENLD
ncbi:pyruvate carboxyltransferase [Candidatus Roizmanbacteria bacterium RIFCSPHIGHO2_02_FULL_37_15]|uniref:Pyruvate carboxyltransferase n=1 Tax=Candidatus Roizmanbacteria bacterium RIFCSPLOWO2_01_FULL_37_16 TaxID=1802058 RepID=A0A1F7ILP5_9BACT|nr:MAG: pyruvate carboxyltransferase [Candidatus Roizmanbacteria bacterium RIFCSPHIGHO2_01_FULL_37_16b]OGK20889.1 MAG: pyruvate carboxyltransferase [Candidatus Roizmanbacteria bacterium RIFCSPHIGHO2_02_FULL_37_15]OGK33770.1 MAG: pyruvate carboxyltransferase [Candidatus Roizmanbacteria bacterium RIFCSPHIGHO2_12_FULL_36_11]OGK44314.1 MAG: pyruvate carboxyltransferase [Candidatus Roizmanbacteria bacterium RIFCSPLOWO2_01_FULL_37_16]